MMWIDHLLLLSFILLSIMSFTVLTVAFGAIPEWKSAVIVSWVASIIFFFGMVTWSKKLD